MPAKFMHVATGGHSYHTNVIYDASAAFTREQQTSFLTDILPFYGNAVTTQEFLQA